MGETIGSIAVLLCVAALVALIIFGMVRSKRSGKNSSCGCGCGCAGCPMSNKCHPTTDEAKSGEKG